MRLVSLLVAFASLLPRSDAFAGAWGMGPFDNDDALDWVWELEKAASTDMLEDALEEVTGSFFYISAPECSRAVAAAEVVAALLGRPGRELPDEVKTWISDSSLRADEDLVALAREAVTLVRDSDKSELADLWRDAGNNYDEWHAGISDLIRRLR